uniref:ZP domain-containing protein n=1 Tax=Angiostrongylus cantonensis TaxID=6313 RepID=A0A0K0D1W1_ANGCA
MLLILATFFIVSILHDRVESRSQISAMIDAKHSKKLSAKCEFSVHRDGPEGERVTGTALDVVLYYSIRCEPQDGYCLSVTNCTISTDEPGFKPYPMIDQNGCSLEPSLYDDVTVNIFNSSLFSLAKLGNFFSKT